MSERIQDLRQPPAPEIVERLTLLIDGVVSDLDENRDCSAEIEEINKLSGGNVYTREHFFELYSHTDARTLAQIAAKGLPPAIGDLTRNELIEVISVIETSNDPDLTFFLGLMDRSMRTIWSSDLIFWPTVTRSAPELADYLLSESAR